MAVAGIDIGAVAAKAVIMCDGEVRAHQIVPTGINGERSARRALKMALVSAGLGYEDVRYIMSTGYGRHVFSKANKTITEISAHAAGVRNAFPGARTIIDIGGQDTKAISLAEDGAISNFVMNDKCAAGTGRFLEVMSRVLHVRVAEMGELALKSAAPSKINSMCTVFSESEVISLLTNGRKREDIAAGLCESIAKRVSSMARYVGIRGGVVFSGGVAKNVGMVSALEKELRTELLVPQEPQITGAVGAAILAQRLSVDNEQPVAVSPRGDSRQTIIQTGA